MKIAYLTDSVYSYNKGGKEKRLFEITKRLEKKGHEVHIYTMKWWSGQPIKKEEGITLHGISPRYDLYTPSGKRSIKQAIAFSLAVFPSLVKEDFEVLDIDHMPYFPIFPAWLVAKIKKKKCVITWHEYWGEYWFEYLGWKGVFGYCIEKLASLLGEKIAVSELTKGRLNRKNVIYIPNGINLSEIQNAKKRKAFDVLFVGRLIKEKNVDLLINAVKGKYSLAIIGSGPEEERLKLLAKDYPNILFLGTMKSPEEVYGYMKSAKVFAFPSEREGFGLVVLEAIASGTPVLLIDEKYNAAKFLVNKESISTKQDFEKKLDILVKTPPSLTFDEEKYNWNRIVKIVEEVYRK